MPGVVEDEQARCVSKAIYDEIISASRPIFCAHRFLTGLTVRKRADSKKKQKRERK